MSLAALGQLAAQLQTLDLSKALPPCAVCVSILPDDAPVADASRAATLYKGSALCREHVVSARIVTAVTAAHSAAELRAAAAVAHRQDTHR